MSAAIPRVWYVDDPSDGASAFTLRRIGVALHEHAAAPAPEVAASKSQLDGMLHLEHSFDAPVTYAVSGGGDGCVDVRDSADAWIRIFISAARSVTINAGVHRRVLPTGSVTVAMPSWPADADASSRLCTVRFPRPCHEIAAWGAVHAHAADGAEHAPRVSYRWVPGSPEEVASNVPHFQRPGTPHTRDLVVDLCESFYHLGWVTGTGGSISIRHGERIFMAPSGVQKERMQRQDIYVLDLEGREVYAPSPLPGKTRLKLSQCAPLFHHAFTLRNAGACIHTHDVSAVMTTLQNATEFRITHQEMIKGIAGHGYLSELVVPIIENTPHECDLADSLEEAMRKYPQTSAMLVRRHGVYVWGATWEAAKTQSECYHYLFDAAVRMRAIGVDPAVTPVRVDGIGAATSYGSGHENTGGSKHARATAEPSGATDTARHAHANGDGFHGARGTNAANATGAAVAAPTGVHSQGALTDVDAVVLDIEGTTTSLSFVTDVLFPYAAKHVEAHLRKGVAAGDAEVVEDVAALVAQSQADIGAATAGADAVALTAATLEALHRGGPDADAAVQAVVRNVQWQMSLNRKTGALKQLQGHIWRDGYTTGALKGHVFEDTPTALEAWTRAGVRVYIYSSGSREAQRLLFMYSVAGDLRRYLSGYFDTRVGAKVEPASYRDIALSLGVASPSRVLFATDSLAEARAAAEAGMKVVVTVRPGNVALPEGHGFPVVHSLTELTTAPYA